MKVSIIGAGHVGLVTGACLSELGNDVLCIDSDLQKLGSLQAGHVPFFEPELSELLKAHNGRNLHFGATVREAAHWSEIIFICAGTPPKDDGSADLSAIDDICKSIAEEVNGYCLVVEKSTVPVQTGQRIKETLLNHSNPGATFDVASVPEFLREGSAVKDTMSPDRIVIGTDSEHAIQLLRQLYEPILAPVVVTDISTAEVIKHASNSFLATKISYINAVSQICDRVGADVTMVAQAMGLDHRIGREFLEAGIGYGGSCFPKDVAAFISVAQDLGYDFDLLRAVQAINDNQRKSILAALDAMLGGLIDRRIAVLGLAFKGGTDDVRESPAIDIVQRLVEAGALVHAFDPVASENAKELLGDTIRYGTDPYDIADDADAIVLLTSWPEFRTLDWNMVGSRLSGNLVVDGRNHLDQEAVKAAGLVYLGVGRSREEMPAPSVDGPTG